MKRLVDGRRRAQDARMDLASLQLNTPRLLLRPTQREDFEPWAAFMADPDSARFIGGAQARPVAWRGFLSMAGAWAVQGFAMFSVIEKASGRWIGRVGPWLQQIWRQARERIEQRARIERRIAVGRLGGIADLRGSLSQAAREELIDRLSAVAGAVIRKDVAAASEPRSCRRVRLSGPIPNIRPGGGHLDPQRAALVCGRLQRPIFPSVSGSACASSRVGRSCPN